SRRSRRSRISASPSSRTPRTCKWRSSTSRSCCRSGGSPRAIAPPKRKPLPGLPSRRLVPLPGVELAPRAVRFRVHGALVVTVLGGELDHVAVRVAEIDRVDEAVVGDAAHLDARGLALLEHPLQVLLGDFQGDVKIVVMLLLELERLPWRLEESEARAVVHAVEVMQHGGTTAALGLVDDERVDERQAEEVLVKAPRLLRVAAAIGVVMKTFDHLNNTPSLQGFELLRLDHVGETVEHLVDLRPALQLLHVAEPALDVGIVAEVHADDLAERDEARAEIVGDRDLAAAQVLVLRPDPVLVEDLQPVLRALL